jgi:hypothetical protein
VQIAAEWKKVGAYSSRHIVRASPSGSQGTSAKAATRGRGSRCAADETLLSGEGPRRTTFFTEVELKSARWALKKLKSASLARAARRGGSCWPAGSWGKSLAREAPGKKRGEAKLGGANSFHAAFPARDPRTKESMMNRRKRRQ